MVTQCCGYAALTEKAPLTVHKYTVRDLRDNDVQIQVKYSGICHTDMHMIDNDWRCSQYPMVPGHEIAGVVTAVGGAVKGFKCGDHAGVGYFAWSCRTCRFCLDGQENYCEKAVQNYSFAMPDGELTMGGYADKVVIPAEFAVPLPMSLPMEVAAPLLCAGITCWSPMTYCKMDRPGAKIGVVGCGGLGHMAIQFGAAFGNEVTLISTSRSKEALARQLGAKHFCISTDPKSLRDHLGSLDFIVDTVAADKDINLYLSLLATNGTLVTVGLPEVSISLKVSPASLILKRRNIMGSLVGSISEQAAMMQFCAEKKVAPMIELMPCDKVNECFDRLKKNDVRFRFVLDMQNLSSS